MKFLQILKIVTALAERILFWKKANKERHGFSVTAPNKNPYIAALFTAYVGIFLYKIGRIVYWTTTNVLKIYE